MALNIDIRRFVPKEVFTKYGDKCKWFVSAVLIKFVVGSEKLFFDLLKKEYPDLESVELVVNNWHESGTFNWRGLRTYDYIKAQIAAGKQTATLSQHVGGSSNACDFNVRVKIKSKPAKFFITSDKAHDLITSNEKAFMALGLTTLEDKSITKGWTHADFRFTDLDTLLIVKP